MRPQVLLISFASALLIPAVASAEKPTLIPDVAMETTFRTPPIAYSIPISNVDNVGRDMPKIIKGCVEDVLQSFPDPRTWRDGFVACMAAATDKHVIVLPDETRPTLTAEQPAPTTCEVHPSLGMATCITPHLDWPITRTPDASPPPVAAPTAAK